MWRHIEETRLKGQPTKAQFIAQNFVVDFLSTWHFGEDSNSYRETAQIEQICETYYEPRIRRWDLHRVIFNLDSFILFFLSFWFYETPIENFAWQSDIPLFLHYLKISHAAEFWGMKDSWLFHGYRTEHYFDVDAKEQFSWKVRGVALHCKEATSESIFHSKVDCI